MGDRLEQGSRQLKILVTGGAGFIGSNVAEYYAQKGNGVIVYDNLSRAELLDSDDRNADYNWNYLKKYKNVNLVKADVCDKDHLETTARDVNAIVHTAAQTAVTTSVVDPQTDFMVNALGTLNVLEAARKAKTRPKIIYCSTNKVYGDNVNRIEIVEKENRYEFVEEFRNGVPESFNIDICEHTPYGCSKLTGDLYVQDYGHLYGLTTGVFRMSCIYGTRQFGVEDQGWVAHFAISVLTGKPITIFGDGKQVRDVLHVSDLVTAFDRFLQNQNQSQVFNMGGGPENTLSLLELIEMLEKSTGKKANLSYKDWRPSDQKVYISDISKAREVLKWRPTIGPLNGVRHLIRWIRDNEAIFS